MSLFWPCPGSSVNLGEQMKDFSGNMHPASTPLLQYTLPWLSISRTSWTSPVMKMQWTSEDLRVAYHLEGHNLGSAVSDRPGAGGCGRYSYGTIRVSVLI